MPFIILTSSSTTGVVTRKNSAICENAVAILRRLSRSYYRIEPQELALPFQCILSVLRGHFRSSEVVK